MTAKMARIHQTDFQPYWKATAISLDTIPVAMSTPMMTARSSEIWMKYLTALRM